MIFSKEDKFLLVKIFKDNLKDFDVYDKEQIMSLFKDIFVKMKDKYNMSGLFDADIYVNNEFGMIIEIYNLCFYNGEVDLKIKFHLDSIFLTEINTNELLDYEDVYYYEKKFYSNFKKNSDREVIYKDVDLIINNGIKIC